MKYSLEEITKALKLHDLVESKFGTGSAEKILSGEIVLNVESGEVKEVKTVAGTTKATIDYADPNYKIVKVKVSRNQSPQEAINTTGRVEYVSKDVLNSMPKGEGDDVEVIFFKIGSYISDDELEKEYKKRGLESADPYAQIAVNQSDPSFADNYPNGTHWKDNHGNWCYATFYRFDGRRYVDVNRYDDAWYGRWWFAGVRKSS